MPKRKQGLVGEELGLVRVEERLERAERRIVERYGDGVLGDALIDLSTGRRVDEFERAMDALKWVADDEAEIDKAFDDWLEPYIDREVGWRVRDDARKLKRGKYKKIEVTRLVKAVAYFDKRAVAESAKLGDLIPRKIFDEVVVRIEPEWLCAAVKILRDADLNKQHPSLTFPNACAVVARQFGYSAKQVQNSAKEIKWKLPRRRPE